MRCSWILTFGLLEVAVGESLLMAFDAAREVLEIRCVECHTQEKAKGGLIMTTREGMLTGGDAAAVIKPGDPGNSELLIRCGLPADDDDRMPPKKHGEPLSSAEISTLSALPRWDAPPDPRITSIEAFPKEIHLETAADFHRATICSCEVKMEPNLSQALHLLNGDSTQQRIRQGKMVENMLKEKKTPEEIIRTLYLTTLSREPVDMEMEKLMAAVPEDGKREALEDIFWALLNSKEFIFNH